MILLFLWMVVPLAMTLYFSTLHYSLLDPDSVAFIGFQNYIDFLSDPNFFARARATRSSSSARCWPSASSAACSSRC